MSQGFAKAVEGLANEAARIGHALRTGDFDEKQKILELAKTMNAMDLELIKNALSNPSLALSRARLVKTGQPLLAAYTSDNYIALADILEYELINECETILDELGAG